MCDRPLRWFGLGLGLGLAALGCDGRPRSTPSPASPPAVAAIPVAAPHDCPDPVLGRWVARRLRDGEWTEHRVMLERRAHGVACVQEWRSWQGGEQQLTPPRCPSGGLSYFSAQLQCAVTASPGQMRLDSVRLLSVRHTCGGATSEYYLDHFSGTLAGNRWTATNDDGHDDRAVDYTFHRVSCSP